MNIKKSVKDLIGGTPMIRLKSMERVFDAGSAIIGKMEFNNPGGSVKDRIALRMIEDAESSGKLKPGGTIVEPTSGNTGVGLAIVAAAKGYRTIFAMPESMSVERRKILKAFGAELVLTDKSLGMQGSVDKAAEIAKSTPGSFLAGQFENPSNPRAHEDTTGPEIWEDTDGNVDIFVSAFGTGGTVSGTGRFLKAQKPAIKIAAVEPAASPLLSEGHAGPHGIQGIGANFIPPVLDRDVIDEVLSVTDEEALRTMRQLAAEEGLLVGISSGAAVFAAGKLALRDENKGKNIVVLMPDTGERYLSIF